LTAESVTISASAISFELSAPSGRKYPSVMAKLIASHAMAAESTTSVNVQPQRNPASGP